jgi:multiple sugar transport system substrate-binding protein
VKVSMKPLCVAIVLVLALSSVTMAKTTITLLGNFNNFTNDFYKAVDNFSIKHNVEVDIQDIAGWDKVREKAATLAAAGIPADVLYGDNRTLWYHLLNNMAEPLNDLAKRDIDLGRYPAPVLKPLTLKGQLYALPTALSLFNVAYRPSWFAEAGVSAPPTDWKSKNWTWDDFVSTLRKFTIDKNGDGINDQWGVQRFGSGGGFNHIGLWGVYMIGDDVPEYYGETQEVIAAYENTTSLWTKYSVVGGNFVRQTAAMDVFQSFYLNTLLKTDSMFDWAVAAMPKGSQRASQTAFMGFSISNNSPNKELAWQLAKYLAYETEGAILFTRAENRVPVLRETTIDFVRRYSKIMPESSVYAITDAIGYLYDQRYSRYLHGSDISGELNLIWPSIRDGKMSVRDALSAIAPAVRAYLVDK